MKVFIKSKKLIEPFINLCVLFDENVAWACEHLFYKWDDFYVYPA